MKTIQLTKGQVAIVDDEDFNWLNQWKWYVVKQKHNILMSRQIMSCPQDMEVDHINGNSLDNRKINLRICLHINNARNTLPRRAKNSSKYKGIYLHNNKKWTANICFNYKTIYLGSYIKQEDAARAYDKKAKELFGEFAHTNF